MNPTPQTNTARRLLLALTCGLAITPAVWSQTTSGPEKKSDQAATGSLDEKVELSPFVVSSNNTGYRASNTMSGTRLNTKLDDLAASITVITKQQLVDTATADINDLLKYEANTEGTFQYTEWQQDRGYTIDSVSQNPNTANRIRGTTAANIANSNFPSSIPLDSYNIDSVEISRGPNSNIFGLGAAGGSINIITGNANLTRDITTIGFRGDSYGGLRGTIDINRPIFKDKLAVRLSSLYEEKGFERKPSYEKVNRFTGSLTYKPFKKTTIRGTYESYHNYNNRTNSVTPRDTITDWKAAGSPVWDPTFSNGVGGYRLLGGTTYTAVPIGSQGSGALSFPVGIQNSGTGFYNRGALIIDNGQFGFWTVNRGASPLAIGVVPTPLNTAFSFGSGLRYAENAGNYQRANYTDNKGVFHPLLPLYQQPGTSDKSFYDYTSVNFAAPNFGQEKADSYRVELEQWLVETSRHKAAVQLGWYREDIDRYSRNFVGASDGAPASVQVDINEKLLNGDPNPYFLRPYLATSEVQAFRRPETNDNFRATLAYQLDLTQEPGWLKWLGRHSFAGYAEYRETKNVANQFRYRDQMVTGDLINATNLSASNNGTHFASRYYLGDDIRNTGSVVDYSSRWVDYHGSYPFTYYTPTGTKVVTSPIKIDEVFFSTQNPQKREIRTRGLIWQGFFWNDRIIPTFGVRIDHVNSVLGDNVGGDSILNTTTAIADPRFTFNDARGGVASAGRTTSKGVVVKVLTSPRLGLNLHYNTSDNFMPEGAAYTIEQKLLPNPTGSGKDYGFTINLLDNKLSMRFNHYTTFQNNARNGTTGVLATRPLRLDFDTASVTGDGQDLEDAAIGWATQLRYGSGTFLNATYGTANNPNGDLTTLNGATVTVGTATVNPIVLATLDKAQTTALINEAYTKFMGPGIDTAFVDWVRTSGVTLSDVNDISSKGNEIEITYNPNKFWTVKANITQQNAIDTNISATIGNYINKRIDWWQSLVIPTTATPSYTVPGTNVVVPAGQLNLAGQSWFLVGSGLNGNSPRDFYIGNIDSTYTFAVDNAGKRRPQTREWRVNATTNYQLAGFTDNKYLKNMSVGGSVRWEDQAIIGYRGKPAGIDGIQRYRDPAQPLFDKNRYYFDLMASYNLKLFNDKVRARIQLNINNAFEKGRLQAIAVNPDGTPWAYRIIDPRQFILSATFDL